MKIDVREAPAGPAVDAACADVYAESRGLIREEHFAVIYYDDLDDDLPSLRALRPGHQDASGGSLWQPSSDITAAWELVEAMEEQGYWCQIRTPFRTRGDYWCGFTPYECSGWNGQPDYWTNADTAPLAICRAFLLASGIEKIEIEEER